MKIGVVYPQMESGADPSHAGRFAKAVEDLGFDYLLVTDHPLGAVHADRTPPLAGDTDETHTFHDPFVLLGYLAGITERIDFATGVLVLPQRQTVLVARQAADVDLLSGERLRLGVGVGWNPVEFEALGQDFKTRGARQEEQIELLRTLFTEPVVDFSGRFDRVDRAAINPRPTRVIPIWSGGFGERAWDRAARLSDGFIFWGSTAIEDAVKILADMRERVRTKGRSADDFGGEYTSLKHRENSLIAEADAWRAAGGTHFAVSTLDFGLGKNIDAHIDYITAVAKDLALS
ncbi:LLM class F420-dependent oxidoreductase [Mycolicibacterium baixiangningiae]|uniref:LLM class F420-dependent oxidoreductase n=1 Tax=Mycolicibacterium baixiangningiae TaxID=2761578 RepID=UPI0027DA1728|nr:LLM class F420-dependent oxidoreductase [Mycolicibacterium baixiangningiae]